jgi:low affinity Fe/Cu permease
MRRWTRFSEGISHFTGTGKALAGLAVLVAAWLTWGAATDFPHEWEVVMFSVAPILSLVLLIFNQHAQNRDSEATHIKLNELLVSLEEPDSDIVAAECKSDEELDRFATRQQKAAGSGA